MLAFFILCVFIILLDRALKLLIFTVIPFGSSYPLIKNILHLSPVYNTGIAFGLFKYSNASVFLLTSSAAIIVIVYLLFIVRPKSKLVLAGLFLIAAGALSNLADRFFYGHVLDFIDIRIWPVFNIADSAITVGAALLILSTIRKRKA